MCVWLRVTLIMGNVVVAGGAGKKNEKAVTVNKERVEGSSSKAKKEKEAPLSSRREDDYEVLLPSEWPY